MKFLSYIWKLIIFLCMWPVQSHRGLFWDRPWIHEGVRSNSRERLRKGTTGKKGSLGWNSSLSFTKALVCPPSQQKEKTRISTHCINLKLFDTFTSMLLNTICILTYSLFFHCINYASFISIYLYTHIYLIKIHIR